MEDEDLTCLCGKVFTQPNALSNHSRVCRSARYQVSAALEHTKRKWLEKEAARAQKKQKTVNDSEASSAPESTCDPLDAPEDNPGTQERGGEGGQADAENDLDMPIAIRKAQRQRRKPKPFTNLVPEPPAALPPSGSAIANNQPPPSNSSDHGASPTPCAIESPTQQVPSPEPLQRPIRSARNSFGLYREYCSSAHPAHDPDEEVALDDLSDVAEGTHPAPDSLDASSFWPYPNKSCFMLSDWYWNTGVQKSRDNLQKLIDIIGAEDFNVHDVKDASWRDFLGETSQPPPENSSLVLDDDWVQKEVRIQVPFRRSAATGCDGPKEFIVGNFYSRSILSVIKERVSNLDGRYFHYEPYELYWQPDGSPSPAAPPSQRVYGELFTSPSFVEAHKRLQASPAEPGCTLPRVVVALMFSSDETHLAQFGETKLWPLYLQFGNESKYRRSKPSLNLCSHVAYLIKLPEAFKGFVHANTNAKSASASLAAHCLREALHAQLDLILDADFMQAHDHGVVFQCFDGQDRRFYPRVFTFSNDYKDKVVWTGIRNLGAKPCPRCLIPLNIVHNMGMKRDMWWRTRRAREDNIEYRDAVIRAKSAAFEQNYALHGKHVDGILKDYSLVAVENTLLKKFSESGFNLFASMVVDFMHEVESGNWRSLFIHLLRILDCAGGGSLISELDSRYREVPSFGLDTIRRFRRNCSEMKNLAARDWEDMLQCAIPVFDGLLGARFNKQLLELLYLFAHWHGLAKLRMHTDATLGLLSDCTAELGNRLRAFKARTATAFETRELQKEATARVRRTEAAARKAKERINSTAIAGRGRLGARGPPTGLQEPANPPEDAGNNPPVMGSESAAGRFERRPKALNLNTYKFHAMGDYVTTIRSFGTVDSYSTEIGELEHRRSKARYARTSKKNYIKQLARLERRQARLRQIGSRTKTSICNRTIRSSNASAKSIELPYYVGESQNRSVRLFQFMKDNAGDPAIKGFIAELKAHLLPRAQALFNPADASDQPVSFFFQCDCMYEHQRMHFNYTTYDVRRCQDSINANSQQCNVMLLASPPSNGSEDSDAMDHPFIYARVLKIFHVNVVCTGPGTDPKPRRLDILWVRWYQRSTNTGPYELDRLHFPPIGSEGSLGFVDPCDVLRACHLIPRFSEGRRFVDRIGTSKLAKDSTDWKEYYVNRFVDRDMLMRYHWGLGVGHQYAWSCQMDWKWGNANLEEKSSPEEEPDGATGSAYGKEDADDNSSDGDLGLRDREKEDLGSEHSSDSSAWEDDLERGGEDEGSENEGEFRLGDISRRTD